MSVEDGYIADGIVAFELNLPPVVNSSFRMCTTIAENKRIGDQDTILALVFDPSIAQKPILLLIARMINVAFTLVLI